MQYQVSAFGLCVGILLVAAVSQLRQMLAMDRGLSA